MSAPPELVCTPCGNPIENGAKYLAAYTTPGGELYFKVGCEHQPLDTEGAVAVFGSGGCLARWFTVEVLGQPCDHRAPS